MRVWNVTKVMSSQSRPCRQYRVLICRPHQVRGDLRLHANPQSNAPAALMVGASMLGKGLSIRSRDPQTHVQFTGTHSSGMAQRPWKRYSYTAN
jgi:hypothetical protein